MKRKTIRKPAATSPAIADLSRKEKKALKNSIQALNNQANALGILDPLELEPVLIYSLSERKK
ncbi:MAG: hypothetical protein H6Q42_4076 [Deltaproteobacteria bacterium]|nr:hypothetical protein [Deltaproteobacteria bacterium]